MNKLDKRRVSKYLEKNYLTNQYQNQDKVVSFIFYYMFKLRNE